MITNTLGIDPTRTTLLRRQWCHAVDMRFLALGHAITQLIEHQNALGIVVNYNPSQPRDDFGRWAKGSLREVESKIRDLPYEHGAAFTKEGKLLRFYNRGKELSTIEGSNDWAARPGAIFSHNHPLEVNGVSTSFSYHDFVHAVLLKLGEIRAVSSKHTHIMKPINGRWPKIADRNEEYTDYGLKLKEEWLSKYPSIDDDSPITLEEAEKYHNDLKQLAKKHGFYYERVEHNPTSNTRWAYEPDAEKLKQFKIWLQVQINQHILSQRQADNWFTDYVSKAYAKGMARSFEDVRSLGRSQAYYNKKLDFYNGTRAEFLSSSFSKPASNNRINLLAARSYSELKGVTDAMSQQMTRTLVDGMAQGISPREVAVNLNRDVANIGIMRARRVARTETIRAHASGQLQSLRDLGVDQIGVAVELSTAGDNKVCPRCRLLNGIVLTPDEAEGLIPVHDECRCSFTPANVGEPTQGQIRSRSRIMEALRKATPAQVKLSKQLLRKRRVWGSGFDPSKISKVRPRSIV